MNSNFQQSPRNINSGNFDNPCQDSQRSKVDQPFIPDQRVNPKLGKLAGKSKSFAHRGNQISGQPTPQESPQLSKRILVNQSIDSSQINITSKPVNSDGKHETNKNSHFKPKGNDQNIDLKFIIASRKELQKYQIDHADPEQKQKLAQQHQEELEKKITKKFEDKLKQREQQKHQIYSQYLKKHEKKSCHCNIF